MTRGTGGPESTIGGRIATARFRLAAQLGRNVTQAWLASQCGVAGPTVSQWESGVIEPSIGSLAKIAAALKVSPGWLAFGAPVDATDAIINPALDRKLTDEEIERARAQVAADRASKSGAAKKRGGGGRRQA